MIVSQSNYVAISTLTGTFNNRVKNYCHSNVQTGCDKFLKKWLIPVISTVATLILASTDLTISFFVLPIMCWTKNYWKNLVSLIWTVVISPFKFIANLFCYNSQPNIDYLRPFLCFRPYNLPSSIFQNSNYESITLALDHLALKKDNHNQMHKNFKAALELWIVLRAYFEKERILPDLLDFINNSNEDPLYFILKNKIYNFKNDEHAFKAVMNAISPHVDLDITDKEGNPALLCALPSFYAVEEMIKIGFDPNKIISVGANSGKTVFEAYLDKVENEGKVDSKRAIALLSLLLSNMTITPRLSKLLNEKFSSFLCKDETLHLADFLVKYGSHNFLTELTKEELVERIIHFSSYKCDLFSLVTLFLEFAIEKFPDLLSELIPSGEFNKIFTRRLVEDYREWQLLEKLIHYANPVSDEELFKKLFLNAVEGSEEATPLLEKLLNPKNCYPIDSKDIKKGIWRCHYIFERKKILYSFITDPIIKKEILEEEISASHVDFVRYCLEEMNISSNFSAGRSLLEINYFRNFMVLDKNVILKDNIQEIHKVLLWNGSIVPSYPFKENLSKLVLESFRQESEKSRIIASEFFTQIFEGIRNAVAVLPDPLNGIVVSYLIWKPENTTNPPISEDPLPTTSAVPLVVQVPDPLSLENVG